MAASAAGKMQFHGVYTALVTPFTPDGSSVDYASLRQLVERQISAGIDGLVPVSVGCVAF